MTSGYNTTTVSVTLEANDMLTAIALIHGLSKVDIVSALLLGCVTLDREQVDRLISSGHIVKELLRMGAMPVYPHGILAGDEMHELPIVKLLASTKE
jgi:hypothetical protein